MQIEFVKFDGEQFCRLHSGHLRRSPRKEEDSFAEYEEALLNFE
ncbi:hypothetical protein T03_5633 [Trichinella britovi]|uniref:Uncharacterized protein n=1 Tax=Trichinella britovi TaxID=45882 RepID=A0A0V1AK86_TRIBR|nr:hypothetical protein T03_9298 [Trichinella britovi]KRY25224.1 hypothetical protein T03_5633 [Trichinella britovi]